MAQLREDALKVKAYESLLEDKDTLLSRAATTSIEALMADADAKQTLSALTRRMLGTTAAPPRIDGLISTRPIIERAFEVAEAQVGPAGLDGVAPADRLFTVELPGDYKLAVVRLDAYRPLTRRDFERQVAEGGSNILFTASRIGAEEPPEPAWTLDALIRYTGLTWADGFGPDDGGEDDTDQAQ